MSSITYILAALLVLQATSVLSAEIGSRITGGKDAFPGEYPYQVSIQYGIPPIIKYRPVCGGAILNASWVLTSASCVSLIPKIGKIQVKAGKHELENDGEWVQAVEASLRLIHSGFKSNLLKAIKPNDIALLKLKSPLVLNKRVQPIALPPANKKLSGNALLTGWGSVSKNIIPQRPKVLQVANVSIISDANCNDALSSLTDNEKLAKNQLCTGPLDKEKSACVGDLGDPLVQASKQKSEHEAEQVPEQMAEEKPKQKLVLIGVTSWSPYPCGQRGNPTVYTQVSPFVNWIRKRIQENS